MGGASLLVAIALAACSGGSSTTTGPAGDGGALFPGLGGDGGDAGDEASAEGGAGSPSGDCATQQIASNPTGGCAPRLVTPQVCEVVDLRGGNVYELAWTTDGSGCETPWKICVAGDPLSDPNSRCVELSTDTSAGISSTGGVVGLSASDLDGLTSSTGVYHLLVASFYGSHLGSVGFRVVR